MSDYLWDKTGKPDAEVERLENLLGRFQHNSRAPDFSAVNAGARERNGLLARFAAIWRSPRLAIVGAAVAVAIAAGWYAMRAPRPSWEVTRVTGAPQIGSNTMRDSGKLRVGQFLETDATSRATLEVEDVGELDVDPSTRLKLVRAREGDQRFALERGTIHALIWAPPGQFSVDTPSATAHDLGCQYTLHVDPNGNGELRVSFGWVAFEQNGHESFVPADAMAITRAGFGPGTPFYQDASPKLREALEQLDFELRPGGPKEGISGGVTGGVTGGVSGGITGGVRGGVSGGVAGGIEGVERRRMAAIATVTDEARKRDALTLWHLLSRTDGDERVRVYETLAKLVPPPQGVTRDGILTGDVATQGTMRDLWWDTLGLEDTTWWRRWKGPVPGP